MTIDQKSEAIPRQHGSGRRVERQGIVKTQKSPDRCSGGLPAQSARSSLPTHPLIHLQRSIGNRAVQRLINSPYIQAKLQVSTPDDLFEQKADRVADTVMRMPNPHASLAGLVQRQTAAITAIQPGLLQRQKDKKAEARERVVKAMADLKAKFQLSAVSEENNKEWTEQELRRVDAAFSKMTPEEQAKLKGLALIRTDKLSVERKGKKIDVVGMAGGDSWIRVTAGAFKTNMAVLHEAGHVIHHRVAREVEEKLRKSKIFTDLETARKAFDAVIGGKMFALTPEQQPFFDAMKQVTDAAVDFMNSDEANRPAKQSLLQDLQLLAGLARTPIEKLTDRTSKLLLEAHSRQEDWITALIKWMDEKTKVVGPRENLTEFVDIVNKNKLARKGFAPFTDYVQKFWPDKPGEFFAESYAKWRDDPSYMKKNARALFDWFEKKAHLSP